MNDRSVPKSDAEIQLPHLPALDGLRGIAVLLVLVYHSMDVTGEGPLLRAFDLIRGGLWCGVDLFFVLSGFLITRILLATRDRPHYFKSFYARRTLRIFPLYYGILFAMFVAPALLAWLAGGRLDSLTAASAYEKLSTNQLWLWTYTQNFLQARGPSQLPGFGHFWSLAIEEQFYLVWPAVVLLLGRGATGARRLGWFCVMIAAACLAARVYLLRAGHEPWAIFHYTFTRCDTLAWGALAAGIAYDAKRMRAIESRLPTIIAAASIALAICGWQAGGLEKLAAPIQTVGYTLFAILFAAIVLRASSLDRQHRLLTSSPLRTLGRYSYAMYVFHWPLCRLVQDGLERTGLSPETGQVEVLAARLLQLGLVLAGSFLLAWLSWHLWEKHWLRLKRHFPY